MKDSSNTLPPAGVIIRLVAMVYDGLLVFAVLFAATIPVLILEGNHQRTIENEQVVNNLEPLIGISGWPFQIYVFVIYMSFFCWFWIKNGQTLGMQAWRLEIQDFSGNRISLKQCLVRLFGASISLLCFGAGYWWIWIDNKGLSWHDHLSQSRMVQHPKK
jgi:uncharacterized RDD family membrane protein YckC